MASINRRNFLLSGAAGAAGLMVMAPVAAAGIAQDDKKIIYRTLGRTGLKVPVVSLGVMRADNPGLVKSCFEKGITFFDTANGYQNGRNEEMLGTVLKDYPRDSYIIATKVKPTGIDRDGKPTSETSISDFEAKFKTSLERLQMSYVDILYIHDVSTAELVNYEPLLASVKKLKKEGKCRFIGISTHKNEPLVIEEMIKNGSYDVVLTSYNFKQEHREPLGEAIKKASDAGLGVVAMKTLAGGFLDRERTQPVNTSAAIKWALANPGIHTTIPGMTTLEQLDKNLPVLANITMSEQEKKDITIATAETGLYCNACSQCLPMCPKNLPVPEMMRAYMYAYGYGSPVMASDLLHEIGVGSDPCSGCTSCSVICKNNFKVKERIADISRVVSVPTEFLV